MDADRVTISYPADLSNWGRRQLRTPWFETYLRRTVGEVGEGREWGEFLDVGCCGNSLDVPLRIEHVEAGSRMGETTVIRWTEREACGIEGGWRVQSAAGPTAFVTTSPSDG